MVDLKKYLTVRQIAKLLDITEEWVRDLIAKKEIKATKVGRWRIKQEDLEVLEITLVMGMKQSFIHNKVHQEQLA